MEYSAQRVRAKTRAAIKRREDQVEIEEMESGELNLIPYLDIVTNLMLFLLASVSAGIILTQIDTTLPDKAAPGTTKPPPPGEDQPLKLFVSVKRDEMILWSATGLEGTLKEPKPGYIFKRIGRNNEECDGPYMCESNNCDATNAANGIGVCRESKEEAQPVFEYHRLNDTLYEIANRRYASANNGNKPRNPDTFSIVLQADGAIPYSTIVSTMAAMRCKLPKVGVEATMCMLPTDFSKNPDLKDLKDPIAPPDCPTKRPCKWFDTKRAPYDPKTMALFPDIQFSSGFE